MEQTVVTHRGPDGRDSGLGFAAARLGGRGDDGRGRFGLTGDGDRWGEALHHAGSIVGVDPGALVQGGA
ncbi:hypothetical protein [Nocardia sp. NPDC050710]|uniref:hypothetical protein n=1 Tax=Nocardia sp. NPDC050710 TaxID=3157220 RepID=UPI0033EFEC53